MPIPPALQAVLNQMKNSNEGIHTRYNYYVNLHSLREYLDFELKEFELEYGATKRK